MPGNWTICDTTVRNLIRGFYLLQSYLASLVIGITAWYLSHFEDTPIYPSGRLIFTVIISGLAFVYTTVLVFSWAYIRRHLLVLNSVLFGLAFFAAFGALIEFDYEDNWHGWEEVMGKRYLDCWRTTEAFAFISGFTWLSGALLAYPAIGDRYVRQANKGIRTDSEVS